MRSATLGRPTALTRLAAVVAGLVALALAAMITWMIVHGARTGTLPGSIFMALVPCFLTLFLIVSVWLLWRGDPDGGKLIRGTLALPLTLFLGGIGTVPFLGDLENKPWFLMVFGAGALICGGTMALATWAENVLRRRVR